VEYIASRLVHTLFKNTKVLVSIVCRRKNKSFEKCAHYYLPKGLFFYQKVQKVDQQKKKHGKALTKKRKRVFLVFVELIRKAKNEN
jgi:hypothetical protein